MKAKVIYLTVIAFSVIFSANAQLEGKKFSTTIEGIGMVNLEFKGNVYELSNSAGIVLVKGNYKINKQTIIFTDTEGPIACENSVHGEYKFV